MEMRPPWYVCVLLNERSKRSSQNAGAAMSSSAAMKILSIRSMVVVLPQDVAQRPLFFRVHRQQLRAQVCVLSVFVDGCLALGDGVVEHLQFFLVADHERRRGLIELRGGECFQVIDGGDVSLLRLLHLVDRGGFEDGFIKLRGVHAPLRDPNGRAEGGEEEKGGSDLPHARPRAALLALDRAFDTWPEQVAVPCRVEVARRDGDLVPVGQLLHAGLARLCMSRGHFEREAVAFEKEIVELIAGDGHDFFHCSWSCFLVEKRIHFEFPSVMSRMPAISAWLRPSISKSAKTARRCSGKSLSSLRRAMRLTSSTALPARPPAIRSSIGVSRILRLRLRSMS